MDFTVGKKQLKKRFDQQKSKENVTLKKTFDKTRKKLSCYVSASGGAYKFLQSYSEEKDIPNRKHEPEGFVYGYEEIPSLNPQDKIYFPLLYSFDKVSATAIEENSECAPFFFNFALRSIISYPIGDCDVYMLDSNVSGDFNLLSPICTELGDMDSEKNMFHYITSDAEMDKLLTELLNVMNRNIRSYVSRYPNLIAYNKQNPSMHEPYHFLFIRNIEETLQDKHQIDKLIKLAHAQNATKAGIYIFYTYDKQKLSEQIDSYFSETYRAITNLLSLSSLMTLPNRHYSDAELTLEPKADLKIAAKVINYVQTQKPPVTVMTFSSDIKNKLATGSLWNPPYKGQKFHLYVPVGYLNATTPKEIDFDFDNSSPHTFVGGKIGSGKTILLHNIILNGALRYSPDKLRFYLADMKGGVSFVKYKQLPHIAALCASSNRHYVESLLELFCNEIDRRASLMKCVGANKLDNYNEVAEKLNHEKLPYLFCIIDEFQELFTSNDTISNNSQKYIAKIHKIGRFEGIFLALCTQSAPSNISRGQVGVKLSLICNPQDSKALIGNEGAAYLRGKGRAIYNPSEAGESKYNQEFQVAYIDEMKELPQYVKQIHQIYLKQNNGQDKYDHLIYDDNDLSAKLSENPVFMHQEQQSSSLTPYIYLGVPAFYRKEHVKFYFHRDSQSNVAICGSDRPSAIRLAGLIALQFLYSYKNTGAMVYIADLQNQVEPTYGKLEFLSKKPEVKYTCAMGLKDMIGEVYQILNMRKGNPTNSIYKPEILLSLLDVKHDGNFAFGNFGNTRMGNFGGPTEKNSLTMLKELIDDGPNYGLHVLLYGYNYANLDFLQNLSNMEIKVALRGGDASKLIRNVGSLDLIDQYGQGFVKMPEYMGLKYTDQSGYGDPFLIYDTLGDEKLRGSEWDTLFTTLPNKQY